jgi:hypothetical protein
LEGQSCFSEDDQVERWNDRLEIEDCDQSCFGPDAEVTVAGERSGVASILSGRKRMATQANMDARPGMECTVGWMVNVVCGCAARR